MAAHVGQVFSEGARHLGVEVGVLLDKLGRKAVKEAQQVVGHQHLAVGACPGPDADRGNAQAVRDQLGQPVGDGLQHQGIAAGLLQQVRVFHQPAGGLGRLALRLEPAQLVYALRRQAQVAHHRDAGGHDGLDGAGHRPPAFQLDGIHAGFLQKAPGIAHRLAGGGLVRHERHVADEVRGLGAARHGLGVVEHVFHGHGQGGLVAQHHHAQGVAHQDGVDPGAVHGQRGGIVVGGEHRNRLPALLLGAQAGGGDLLAGIGGGGRHGYLLL